jgi:CBS domain-containing protein
MNVLEICQRHVVTVRRHEELLAAARMMREKRGRLAGILVLDDIFEHLSQCVPFAATPIRRETRIDLAALP